MKTPSLFAHYWSKNEILTTFQEVMNWDINPIIIEIIQTEITHQLHSEFIQQTLPNFNWDSNRFTEKWGAATQSLLIHVTLPEKIWLDWIQDLTNKTISTTEESKSTSLEEIYPSFDELLNAEVYYSSPADSLEEMPDDTEIEDDPTVNEEVIIDEEIIIEEVIEIEMEENTSLDEVLPSIIENESADFDSINDTPTTKDLGDDQDVNQEATIEIIIEDAQKTEAPIEHTDIEFSVLNVEIGSKAPSEKKILDILSDSPEEKVFEKLQSNQDNSLKDRIHTEMTSSLAETLPLFQKINFIQNLFNGESAYLDQIIQFIDHEANKSTDWKSILQTKYAEFQRVDNQELWNELYELIERKFS
jgi:hypothetical protein